MSQMQNVLNGLKLWLSAQQALFLSLLVGFSPWGREVSHTELLGKSTLSFASVAFSLFPAFPNQESNIYT